MIESKWSNRLLVAKFLLILTFLCGCASGPNIRELGDLFETVPVGSEIAYDGEAVRFSGIPELNDFMVFVGEPEPAPYVVDHILAYNPNEMQPNLVRIYPRNLLKRLQDDDAYFRVSVREQNSFMSGEFLLFLSVSNEFKGYWAWSSRWYSQDSPRRLSEMAELFKEPIMQNNIEAMKEREAERMGGGRSLLVPALPLRCEPVTRSETPTIYADRKSKVLTRACQKRNRLESQ